MYNRKFLVFFIYYSKVKKGSVNCKKSLEFFCYKDIIGMGFVGVWIRFVSVIDGLLVYFIGY